MACKGSVWRRGRAVAASRVAARKVGSERADGVVDAVEYARAGNSVARLLARWRREGVR